MARSRKKKKKLLTKKDKQGVALIGLTFIGLVILTSVPLIVGVFGDKFDEETFCPTEQVYAHTVILIDKTDPLTESQEDTLRSKISKLRNKDLQLYEKLSIYVLDDRNYAFPEPRFAFCNPGGRKHANRIYQNPELMQNKFDEVFGTPLNKALADIQLGDTRPSSPIMEMIQTVGRLRDFRPTPTHRRRLIIFSDMLQNVPDYSHYRTKPDYRIFKENSYAQRLRVDLGGVEVRIIYLLRNGARHLQTNAHGLFWEQYLESLGAQLSEIAPSQ